MYDINGDGLLDKHELSQFLLKISINNNFCFFLAQIIKLIYEVNGKRNIKQELTPRDKARMIIDKFDTDGDRKISRQEFISGCLNDSELRKLLKP